MCTHTQHTQKQARGIRNWNSFSEDVREIIRPLLYSIYKLALAKPTHTNTHVHTYTHATAHTQTHATDAHKNTHTKAHHHTQTSKDTTHKANAVTIHNHFTMNTRTAHADTHTHATRTKRGRTKRIYYHYGINFIKWLSLWARSLINTSKGERREVFRACGMVIRDNPMLTMYLLPYLIKNNIITNKEKVTYVVKKNHTITVTHKGTSVHATEVVMNLIWYYYYCSCARVCVCVCVFLLLYMCIVCVCVCAFMFVGVCMCVCLFGCV